MAKKPLLSLPINAQLVSNLERSTNALPWKGAYTLYPTSRATAAECDKKKKPKRACQLLKF